jgi:hypothetical protein
MFPSLENTSDLNSELFDWNLKDNNLDKIRGVLDKHLKEALVARTSASADDFMVLTKDDNDGQYRNITVLQDVVNSYPGHENFGVIALFIEYGADISKIQTSDTDLMTRMENYKNSLNNNNNNHQLDRAPTDFNANEMFESVNLYIANQDSRYSALARMKVVLKIHQEAGGNADDFKWSDMTVGVNATSTDDVIQFKNLTPAQHLVKYYDKHNDARAIQLMLDFGADINSLKTDNAELQAWINAVKNKNNIQDNQLEKEIIVDKVHKNGNNTNTYNARSSNGATNSRVDNKETASSASFHFEGSARMVTTAQNIEMSKVIHEVLWAPEKMTMEASIEKLRALLVRHRKNGIGPDDFRIKKNGYEYEPFYYLVDTRNNNADLMPAIELLLEFGANPEQVSNLLSYARDQEVTNCINAFKAKKAAAAENSAPVLAAPKRIHSLAQDRMERLVGYFMFGSEHTRGNIDGIKALLEEQADQGVTANDFKSPYGQSYGGSLLNYLVAHYNVHRSIAVIQLVMNFGADPTVKSGTHNKTAFEYNAEANKIYPDFDKIDFILTHGKNAPALMAAMNTNVVNGVNGEVKPVNTNSDVSQVVSNAGASSSTNYTNQEMQVSDVARKPLNRKFMSFAMLSGLFLGAAITLIYFATQATGLPPVTGFAAGALFSTLLMGLSIRSARRIYEVENPTFLSVLTAGSNQQPNIFKLNINVSNMHSNSEDNTNSGVYHARNRSNGNLGTTSSSSSSSQSDLSRRGLTIK